MRQKKIVSNLSEEEIMSHINQLLYNYQMFENDIVDLMNFSGMKESWCRKVVVKRYKDFIIN